MLKILREMRRMPRMCMQWHVVRKIGTGGKGIKQEPDPILINILKKLGSSVMFGTTLAVVLLAKRKKNKEKTETFKDCVLLPQDYNYASSLKVYQYRDFVLPDFVVREKSQIEKFDVRQDDVYVVSFPKSGTTWIQEIVYLLGTNLDFKGAEKTSLDTRFPYLEFIYPGMKAITKMKSVRFIKTHLPYSLLPPDIHEKKPKIIYVMRNPKDVAVSYFHYVEMLTPTSYEGTFEEFLKSFMKDKVMYGPVWKHNLEYWEHQNEENILVVKYEDLHKDIRNEIRRISRFLEKDVSDEDIDKIADHCSFEKMAKNPSVNYEHLQELGISHRGCEPFMRKGKVGDWRNYFTSQMNEQFEKWKTANYKKSGLEFVYDFSSS